MNWISFEFRNKRIIKPTAIEVCIVRTTSSSLRSFLIYLEERGCENWNQCCTCAYRCIHIRCRADEFYLQKFTILYLENFSRLIACNRHRQAAIYSRDILLAII